jgi:hypothetical protein
MASSMTGEKTLGPERVLGMVGELIYPKDHVRGALEDPKQTFE